MWFRCLDFTQSCDLCCSLIDLSDIEMAGTKAGQLMTEVDPSGRRQPWRSVVESRIAGGADYVTKGRAQKPPFGVDEPGDPPFAA